MLLFLLSYLGGVLTILSPCVLPVLPFVFARADQPFVKSGLPLLLGMAVTFSLVATLAAIGGGWAVHANQVGRIVAMIVLAFFGLTLISRTLADLLTRPLVSLGNRLTQSAENAGGIGASLLLGVATGLLWAPCAGPILGLVLTGAALQGASASTTLLLLAYGAGAATSLGAALLLGGRVFALMKKSLGAGEWVRRGLGVLVLAGVAAIAFGLDTGFLSRLSTANTSRFEQSLLSKANGMSGMADSVGAELRDLGPAPDFTGATAWINTAPLTSAQLRGKTILVDFWTYSCINCLRSLPYVRAWEAKYRDHGLVVIGVHAPEFAFERDEHNVRQAVHDLGVVYPVAMDNNFAIWRAFNNRFWPQHYLIDARGHIRYVHSGEGEYENTEHAIQALLVQDGQSNVPMGVVNPNATGAMAEATQSVRSPETYVGYARAENFASGEQVHDQAHSYATPAQLALNQWGFTGNWTIAAQPATANAAGDKLTYRFHARDLHLVMGPGAQAVRIRVRVDGQAPGANHGADLNAAGEGVVSNQRLYQLLRFASVGEHTFEIEFRDAGAQVFSFTFG
ncbi:MAG: cytochrome c biogenesis protein DipZ [Pseudomonadota bacterium]